ncbi:MAG TPA: permease prefix domain 1-containing protein [Vicinamibacterales bacterium]
MTTVLQTLRSYLMALFRWQRHDNDLDEELRAYLESSIAAYVKRGATPDEAERAARIDLGSVAALKEDVRAVGWSGHLHMLWQDVPARRAAQLDPLAALRSE